MKGLKKLDVNVVLGERVTEWPDEPERLNGKTKRVVTDKGSVFEADLVVSCCDPAYYHFNHTLPIPFTFPHHPGSLTN
jgi:phytoene dehydrogenase-like protein